VKHLFFIVGAPRSGTTLLQQALNRHSQIAIPPETAYLTFLKCSAKVQREHLQRINADLQIALPMPMGRIWRPEEANGLFWEMARQYLQQANRSEVTHFGEKSPEHQRRLQLLWQTFPDAKVILIYRDGRGVAHSCTKLPWMSPDLYVNFALWLHYYQIQKRVAAAKNPHLLIVKYEDLATNPEQELRKVLTFLDLPFEDAVAHGRGNRDGIAAWEFPWKSSALERINTTRMTTWRRDLSTEQISILESWGGRALRELGYELATNGKGRLPLFFYPRLYWKSFAWLAARYSFGRARAHYAHEPSKSAEPTAAFSEGKSSS